MVVQSVKVNWVLLKGCNTASFLALNEASGQYNIASLSLHSALILGKHQAELFSRIAVELFIHGNCVGAE